MSSRRCNNIDSNYDGVMIVTGFNGIYNVSSKEKVIVLSRAWRKHTLRRRLVVWEKNVWLIDSYIFF